MSECPPVSLKESSHGPSITWVTSNMLQAGVEVNAKPKLTVLQFVRVSLGRSTAVAAAAASAVAATAAALAIADTSIGMRYDILLVF